MGGPGQSTTWTGTAFNCLAGEIVLIHSRHLIAAGECNDGAIVAMGISVEGNRYTSQLNVTVTPDIVGKTIVYEHDNLSNITIRLSIMIPTTGLFFI